MSGGGKKLNIWIAYSDLFTNLSTFLFISALGIFAAIGSGAFGQMGPRGSGGCTVSSDIGKAMTQYSDWFEYIGSEAASKSSCSEYYRLKDVRFRLWKSERGYLTHQGRTVERPEMLKQICVPIWLAVPSKDFASAKGRVIIQGSGAWNADLPYEPKCDQLVWSQPQIGNKTFDSGREASGAVDRCFKDLADGTSQDPFCNGIRNCRDPEQAKQYPRCTQITAARRWEANAIQGCRRETARLQAGTLHQACALAPTDDANFPANLADQIMKANESDLQTLADYWSRVDFSAPIETPATPASGLPPQPGGSIVVELRFSR